MIFKSRQVNLDPEPCVDQHGITRSPDGDPAGHDFDTRFHYAPRPEFEPTRDPFPWAVVYFDGSVHDYRADNLGPLEPGERFEFRPRREQFDTPVNRVLVAFRKAEERDFLLANLDSYLSGASGWASLDEIEHARRVLTRLAGAA